MSLETCEYEHEGFCLLEDFAGAKGCKYKDADGVCKAEASDLIDCCPDCFRPIEECKCDEVDGKGELK